MQSHSTPEVTTQPVTSTQQNQEALPEASTPPVLRSYQRWRCAPPPGRTMPASEPGVTMFERMGRGATQRQQGETRPGAPRWLSGDVADQHGGNQWWPAYPAGWARRGQDISDGRSYCILQSASRSSDKEGDACRVE